MFGGRFRISVPDSTTASIPLTERDGRKQMLKDEITKCMQQLEIDENKNPNDAASMTMKSERLRPPIASKGSNSLNNLLGQEVRPSFNQ